MNCLHISANQFPSIDKVNFTKTIWRELAVEFEEYHIIGRSYSNRFENYREGNIILHLVPAFGKRSLSFIFSSFYIFYIIKKNKITRLLAQDALLGGITGVIASKVFKIPIMVEIHGDIYFNFFFENNLKKKILSKISKFVFVNATKVRSLSNTMSDILNQNGIKNNVVLIPNRVNISIFKSKRIDYSLHDPIRVISVGRFVEQKGYDIAIKAILELTGRYNIELYLIGGGALFQEYEKIKKDNNNIKLINWIDQIELVKLFDDCDIYIQPSKPYLGEAMPRTLLEAMAMKLPIISTNIAAIPGVLIHDSNSLLINPNSTKELIDAIESLINNLPLRTRIGNRAFQDVNDNYEWNKVFSLYRKEISSMVITLSKSKIDR